jgi:hypothetical protein
MRVGWSNFAPRSGPGSEIALEGSTIFDRIAIRVSAREFDEIASGARRQIYLPVTRHWARKLAGKKFKSLVLQRSLAPMQIAVPWPGYRIELVRSAAIEPAVAVYVIDVSDAAVSAGDR